MCGFSQAVLRQNTTLTAPGYRHSYVQHDYFSARRRLPCLAIADSSWRLAGNLATCIHNADFAGRKDS